MVHSMERRGADGCSVAAQPPNPPKLPPKEAAMVGMAQCEEEEGVEKAVRVGVGGVRGGEKKLFLKRGGGEKLLRQSE